MEALTIRKTGETRQDSRLASTHTRHVARVFHPVMLAITVLALTSVSTALADEPNGKHPEIFDANADVSSNRGRVEDVAGQKRCEFFVTQKILSARDPQAFDSWEKDGKRVFEVSYRSTGIKGRVSRICVYDLQTRAALLPAVAEQDSWRP